LFSASGRMRVISDAVKDLTIEIRNAEALYASKGGIKLDGNMRQNVDRLIMAIDGLTRQLEAVNANISRLSHGPLMGIGALIGLGEQEIQTLTGHVDRLVAVIREVTDNVRR
jgi:hypothetical protein